MRGCSSVDRVLASEAKGRGFDPRQPRHPSSRMPLLLPCHGSPMHVITDKPVRFFNDSFQHATVSMRSVAWG